MGRVIERESKTIGKKKKKRKKVKAVALSIPSVKPALPFSSSFPFLSFLDSSGWRVTRSYEIRLIGVEMVFNEADPG